MRPDYVYVASSWRNPVQPGVIEALKAAGIDAYDFRNPPNGAGFGWEEVMPGSIYRTDGQLVMPRDFIRALSHERAIKGFEADFRAMHKADTFVLVLPCGRSAHLELGWAAGQNKRTAILLDDSAQPMTPELMYLMCDNISPTIEHLLAWLS